MEQYFKINDDITVGPQPTSAQLQQLQSDGIQSIVNFRVEGEDEESLPPQIEGDTVRAAGMTYLHIPVTLKAMTGESVDRFRSAYAELPKPVFAHCKSGKRAAAMAMMNIAVDEGITAEQTFENAKTMGIELGQPELESFMQNYINRHSAAGNPASGA